MIVFGKILCMQQNNTKDEQGNLRYDYHVRMKGMNRIGIDHRAVTDYVEVTSWRCIVPCIQVKV